MVTSPIIELLSRRASVRQFLPDKLDDALLGAIVEAGCRAPTSDNLQAYSLVCVRDAERRAELAVLAGHQRHVAEAPVFLAICADLSKVWSACCQTGKPFAADTVEMGLVSAVDASLVAMAAALAAESLGLGTVMIGGMRNHPLEVAELLGLPQRCFVLLGLCIGWPVQPPKPKPRQPLAAVFFNERYDEDAARSTLARYDAMLAEHYRALGRDSEPSWSAHAAELGASPRRTDLARHLARRGFPLR